MAKKGAKKRAKRRSAGRGTKRHGLPGPRATLTELLRVPREVYASAPTLESGHTDNLVYKSPTHKVWVSRMSLEDYGGDRKAWEDDRNVVETLVNGRWCRVNRRSGKPEC
jgi:hypothetical protein